MWSYRTRTAKKKIPTCHLTTYPYSLLRRNCRDSIYRKRKRPRWDFSKPRSQTPLIFFFYLYSLKTSANSRCNMLMQSTASDANEKHLPARGFENRYWEPWRWTTISGFPPHFTRAYLSLWQLTFVPCELWFMRIVMRSQWELHKQWHEESSLGLQRPCQRITYQCWEPRLRLPTETYGRRIKQKGYLWNPCL